MRCAITAASSGSASASQRSHAWANSPLASSMRPSNDGQLADDAVAPRTLREAGDLAGVSTRLRRVAGGQHPVDGAQQPLLALGAAGAEAGGGDHRHGRRLHALAGGLALREPLEPLRQVGVRARCRGGEMPQRRALVLDQVGGERVQVGAPARADLVIDGCGDERMGERRRRDRRRVDPAQQARVARLLERVERLLDPAQRRGDRERRAWPEHRHRLQQPRGVLRAGLDAPPDDRRERARRREAVVPVPGLRGELVEERARVERVAAAVRFEPLDPPR